MNIVLHKSSERGFADHGWLRAAHSFSFAQYHNPEKMSFGALRVLNDDTIAPLQGFPNHPHKDMEIITIPLSGELGHTDDMGNEVILFPGDIQVMSAGGGVVHSEVNSSDFADLSLLQIWIEPNQKGVKPRHDEKHIDFLTTKDKLHTIASGLDTSGGIHLYQKAEMSIGTFVHSFKYDLKDPQNGLYVFLISGKVMVEENILIDRDAVGITDAANISIEVLQESLVLLIEVPML